MKFSEYYKYFENESEIIENIKVCARKYIKKIMMEQTVSIGKPSVVRFDESHLLVHSDKKRLQVEVSSYKLGTSLYLEIFVNNRLHRVSINPIYFKEENIKNYLRECEIDIKNNFYKIRKASR